MDVTPKVCLASTPARLTPGGSMSTRSLIYTAAVALAVVVAYDKYGKRA